MTYQLTTVLHINIYKLYFLILKLIHAQLRILERVKPITTIVQYNL